MNPHDGIGCFATNPVNRLLSTPEPNADRSVVVGTGLQELPSTIIVSAVDPPGMVRPLVGIVGVLTALFPDRIIDIFETTSIENVDEITIKPWVSSVMRTEGILVAGASLVGRRPYAWLMTLTGFFGAILLLFPQLYRRFAAGFLYEEPDQVKWNEQFTTGVRIIGGLYILVAASAFTQRRTDD